MRWYPGAAIAALLGLASLITGCGGSGSFLGGPSASTPAAPAPSAAAPPPASSSNRWVPASVSNFFEGSSDKAPQAVAGASADLECPYIQIREGASTLVVNGAGDNNAMALKYQGTFVRAARQCSVAAGQMIMKIGVEGRIILGPQGAPGQLNVPLRIAIVDEKPSSSKTIATKLILVPVMIASVADNPDFAHVEDLSFPLPASDELDNYIVYIGFDPLAVEAQSRHEKPVPKVKRKPKPAPTG